MNADIVTTHCILLRGFLLARLPVPDDNLSRECLIMRVIVQESSLFQDQFARRFRGQ